MSVKMPPEVNTLLKILASIDKNLYRIANALEEKNDISKKEKKEDK